MLFITNFTSLKPGLLFLYDYGLNLPYFLLIDTF